MLFRHTCITLTLLLMVPSGIASADVLFFDNFEGASLPASVYTGKSSGPHNGVIVADPIQSDNALTFTALNGAGDIFTTATFSHPSNQYFLEFDYLGDPNQGGNPGNLGGFIGYSFGLPGLHAWLAGTGSFPTPVDLPDTGQWEHVIVPFTTSAPFHLMLEDFFGSGGVAGDAYFDNLTLHGGSITPIPEPASIAVWSLLLLAGMTFVYIRRRKLQPVLN